MTDFIPQITPDGGSDFSSLVNLLMEELYMLRSRVEVLEERRKRATKSGLHAEELLTEMKLDFQASDPYRRTDPFSDDELTIWCSFVLSKTTRREKIVFTEFIKRKKKIKDVVKHFTEYAKEVGKLADDKCEAWARIRTKDFIEFVLLGVKFNTGDYPNFWQATSAWALNNYADKVASWQQAKRLGDEPA